MREILFRGKDTKTGQWRYSMTIARQCYDDNEIFTYYIGAGNSTIDGKTLGQFTGLTDKNGKKIFEGDYISIHSSNWWCGFTNNQLEKSRCRVYYSEENACFKFNDGKFTYSFNEYLHKDSEKRYSLEVIGNIHDNPELLEVQNENN